MKNLVILFAVSISFLIPVSAQKSRLFSNKTIKIRWSGKDKVELIKSVLSGYVFPIKYLNQNEKMKKVYLSTKNISSFIPKDLERDFVLVNSHEVTEKAKTGFGYFAFQKIQVERRKVLVSFGYNYQDTGYGYRNPSSSGSPDSTNGINYEFRKIKGKWRGKAISGYASGS